MAENILIINQDSGPEFEGFFLKNEGFTIIAVSNYEEAVNALGENNFSLIIADIDVPNIIPFIESVSKKNKSLAIIVTVNTLSNDKAIEALDKGAFAYLKKPLDMEELKIMVNKAINWTQVNEENASLKAHGKQHEKEIPKEKKTSPADSTSLKLIIKTRKLELMHEELKKVNLATVKTLAKAIEAKDSFTIGHCTRVQQYSLIIAKSLNLSKSQLERLEYGAYMHDIGKLGVSEAILIKPGKLTKKEYDEVCLHPVIGENILKDIEVFQPLLPMVRNHHEDYNGEGYPDKLKGEKIPLMARILHIVDVFDAVTSNRSYRLSMKTEQALDILRSGKGTQFDPDLVDIFISNYIKPTKINN